MQKKYHHEYSHSLSFRNFIYSSFDVTLTLYTHSIQKVSGRLEIYEIWGVGLHGWRFDKINIQGQNALRNARRSFLMTRRKLAVFFMAVCAVALCQVLRHQARRAPHLTSWQCHCCLKTPWINNHYVSEEMQKIFTRLKKHWSFVHWVTAPTKGKWKEERVHATSHMCQYRWFLLGCGAAVLITMDCFHCLFWLEREGGEGSVLLAYCTEPLELHLHILLFHNDWQNWKCGLDKIILEMGAKYIIFGDRMNLSRQWK